MNLSGQWSMVSCQLFILLASQLILGVFIPVLAAQENEFLHQGLDRIAEEDTSGAIAAFSHADGLDIAAHYNAGTLALERGELGMARFHLEAASRMGPFSEPVAHNLSLTHEQLEISRSTPNLFAKSWRWIATHIGLVGLVLVTLALYLAALVLLWLRKRNSTRWTTPASIVFGFLAVGFLGFSTAALWNTQRPEAIVIAQEDVPLRTTPNPDAPSHGSLRSGHSIRLLEKTPPWAKILTRNHTFWVPLRTIGQLPF